MSAVRPATRVPGPPRGRRQPVLDDVLDRVEAMRAAERDNSSLGSALLRLLSDVVLLLKDLATDPRVSTRDKLLAGCAAAYLVSPLDLVPGFIPLVGQADDLVVAAWAFRRLLGAAGYDVIYELWRGSDEGLALVLALAGVQE
jgi:uncharacterized membrane protein YkvA (DUF1232 family)